MTNDIFVIKIDDADSVNVFQHQKGFFQTRNRSSRQIDLSRISCNHEFGVLAHTRQEHFHLGMCCVLCFIENNEGIVERTSAHESQGCNLDYSF
ncbi:hypothetical protein D9M69_724510 [compost metagenome]